MYKIVDSINNTIFGHRQTGNTTSLIKILEENENSVLVVGDMPNKRYVVQNSSLPEADINSRVYTVHDVITNNGAKIRGLNAKNFIFDNSAISNILSQCAEKYAKLENKSWNM